MSTKLSVEDVLATLEARATFHRDREAFHAEQAVHHGEQRAVHAAELKRVEASLEAFRASAPTALELARERVGLAPESAESPVDPAVLLEDLTATGRMLGSRLIRRIVASWNAEKTFGPSDVAGEVNRRHRAQLRRPVDARAVSNVLRRMQSEGKIALVRPGKAFHEAQYRRGGS